MHSVGCSHRTSTWHGITLAWEGMKPWGRILQILAKIGNEGGEKGGTTVTWQTCSALHLQMSSDGTWHRGGGRVHSVGLPGPVLPAGSCQDVCAVH